MKKRIILAAVVLVFAGAGCWWNLTVYNECRAAGNSMSYCLRVVSR